MKRATRASAMTALMLGLVSQSSYAAITVTPSSLSGYTISVTGSDVTISGPGASGSGQTFTVASSGVSEDIGTITVTNTTNGGSTYTSIRLNISSNGGLQSVVRHASSGNHGEVWIGTATVRENIGAYNSGNNTRTGAISVNHITSLTCDRNVYADFEVTGSHISSDPDLGYLETTGNNAEFWGDGNLSANITAVGGFATSQGIGSLIVAGSIGSIDGHRVSIDSAGTIDTIYAGSLADMDLYAPSSSVNHLTSHGFTTLTKVVGGGWGGDPVIPYGVPIGDPEPDPVPDTYTLPGTLECNILGNFAVVANMESAITTHAAPSSTNVWKIGKSLTEDAVISLEGDEDLTFQMIINQQDAGGTQDGTVTVGERTLENLYDDRPYQIGGGSVGVADFKMHETACVPINADTWPAGHVNLASEEEPPPCELDVFDVKIHYYGEITQPENGCAVRVWKHSDASPWEFFPPPGDGWTEMTSSLHSSTDNGRDLLVSYNAEQPWQPGYTYWFELQENTLLCNLHSESYAPVGDVYVAPHPYWFILVDNCEELFDRNMSGSVTSADLAIQLDTPRDYDETNTTEWRDTAIMLRWMSEHP